MTPDLVSLHITQSSQQRPPCSLSDNLSHYHPEITFRWNAVWPALTHRNSNSKNGSEVLMHGTVSHLRQNIKYALHTQVLQLDNTLF